MNLEPLYLLNHTEDPVDLLQKVKYNPEKDITPLFTLSELERVQQIWDAPQGPASKGWTSGTIGWLEDTTNGIQYGRTEYAKFLAVAMGKSDFNKMLQSHFTAAVGCAVLTADGFYLVQERAPGLLASQRLDSSAAGMGVIVEGKLDLEEQIKEKLKRELNLDNPVVIPTGIHGAADFVSSQFTWKCQIEQSFEELKAKANSKFIQRVHAVHQDDLVQFILDHYKPEINDPQESLIADAVGVFLRAMPREHREITLERLDRQGAPIQYAVVREGRAELV